MNDHCPKDELVLYLKEFEQNPEIHVIPSLYADDLNGLYARLHYYDTHPAISIWFCFFDDVLRPVFHNQAEHCPSDAYTQCQGDYCYYDCCVHIYLFNIDL